MYSLNVIIYVEDKEFVTMSMKFVNVMRASEAQIVLKESVQVELHGETFQLVWILHTHSQNAAIWGSVIVLLELALVWQASLVLPVKDWTVPVVATSLVCA